jgi:PAS domain S-box-containing protein
MKSSQAARRRFAALCASLHARLSVLIVLTALPALGIAVHHSLHERTLLAEQNQRELQELARTVADDLAQSIRGAGMIMAALAKTPEITATNNAACRELLQQMVMQEPRYGTILIIGPNGHGLCGTEAGQTGTNYNDREYFQTALRSTIPLVGRPIIGRVIKKPFLPITYPILDSGLHVRAILVLTVDLSWYGESFGTAAFIRGASFALWSDEDRRIFYRSRRSSNEAGERDEQRVLSRALPERSGLHILDTTGLEQEPRIYATSQIHGYEDLGLRVIISTAKRALFEAPNRKLAWTLLFILVAVSTTLIASRQIAARSIENPVNRLVEAAKRIEAGDLSIRITEPLPSGELGTLAAAFNNAVASRQAQRDETLRQRAFLREVIDLDRNFIFVKDRDGRYTLANQSLAEAFGTSVDYLIGKTDAELNLNVEEVEACRRSDLAVINNPQQKSVKEEKFTDAAGHERWYEMLKQPMLSTHGTVEMLLGVGVDITARKQAAQQIRQLNTELDQRVKQRTAELERANGELESFSYSVSHDLRAPLRHIQGFAELLVKEAGQQLSPKALHYLETITETSQRMANLIDDLLAFSRTGRVAMSETKVDLNSLVREIIINISAMGTNGRHIDWKISGLPDVRGDEAMLRQVFVNLLENAIKYTMPRNPAVIEVGCLEEKDGEYTLLVRDNGVGFDMEHATKLFGVFQRLHSEKDFPGTGIGLANVRRIIDRHGGRVWAQAEPDKGAAFYLTLKSAQSNPALLSTSAVGNFSFLQDL